VVLELNPDVDRRHPGSICARSASVKQRFKSGKAKPCLQRRFAVVVTHSRA
jgi:hypothetical protein